MFICILFIASEVHSQYSVIISDVINLYAECQVHHFVLLSIDINVSMWIYILVINSERLHTKWVYYDQNHNIPSKLQFRKKWNEIKTNYYNEQRENVAQACIEEGFGGRCVWRGVRVCQVHKVLVQNFIFLLIFFCFKLLHLSAKKAPLFWNIK